MKFFEAGQEAFEKLRPLSYPDSDVILMCFSIDNPDSFDNIELKWNPEIEEYCPRVPVILVGNKTDLRNDSIVLNNLKHLNKTPIRQEQGFQLAKKIGACTYLECSAKTREGVKIIFETAARIVLKKAHRDRKQRKKCQIL